MHTKQTDILTDPAQNRLHWLVMQSLKHQKWVLAVVQEDFVDYQVTEMMSANVELMVQYADYLNKGVVSGSMDAACIDRLETLRKKYEKEKL